MSHRPEYALWHSPPGCTGHRLWKMLSARTGATEEEYVSCFERVNLVTGPWRQSAADAAASLLRPVLRGRTVVLLGQSVRRAFGVPRLLVHPQVIDDVTWRQLPHPSGRCHWYNDRRNKHVAELLLEELFEDWRRACREKR